MSKYVDPCLFSTNVSLFDGSIHQKEFSESIATFWNVVTPHLAAIQDVYGPRLYFSNLIEDCIRIVDESSFPNLEKLLNKKNWDNVHLKETGRTKPRIRLQAALMRPGQLSLKVFWKNDDWRGPAYETLTFQRPNNEMAVLRGADKAFRHVWRNHEPRLTDGVRARFWIDREMGFFILAAYNNCLEILSRHFEVELGASVELAPEDPAAPGGNRFIQLCTPETRRLRDRCAQLTRVA